MGEVLLRHTYEISPQFFECFSRVKEQFPWESRFLKDIFNNIFNSVGSTVVGLHDLATLLPALTRLGIRHLGYGATEEHFDAMGKALQLSLRDILQEDCTPVVQASWRTAFDFFKQVMLEGMRHGQELTAVAKRHTPPRKVSSSVGSTRLDIDDAVSQCSSGNSQSEAHHFFDELGVAGAGCARPAAGEVALERPPWATSCSISKWSAT